MKLVAQLAIGFLMIILSVDALSVELSLTPNFSVTGTYTDNLFLSSNNKEDDFITVLSPGVSLEIIGINSGIDISYNPAYAKYQEFDENDTWRHHAELLAWNDFSRDTRMEFFNLFLRTEDPLGEEDVLIEDEPVVVADTTGRTGRDKYYRNEASLSLSHQFGANDTASIEFEYGLLRNDDQTVQDNDRYAATMNVGYWLTNTFGTDLTAVFTRGEFEKPTDETGTETDDFNDWDGTIRVINQMTRRFGTFCQYNHIYRDYDGDINDDYQIYTAIAGINYEVAENLLLDLGFGYFYQEIYGDEDESGFYVNGYLDKIWYLKRSTIQIIGRTGIERQEFGAENIGFQRFAEIETLADYRFTNRISGDVSGQIRYTNQIGDNDEQDQESIEKYSYRFGAGLDYEMTRWMVVRLEYTFNQFDSNNNTNDYKENRVFFGVTIEPEQPWWRFWF
jgi:hypothetical protein